MTRKNILFAAAFMLTSLILMGCNASTQLPGMAQPQPQKVVSVTLDPDISFQTITGWEATAQAGQIECPSFDQYQGELFDRAVNEMGLNRIRLEVRSGAENPVDYFTQHFITGIISAGEWKDHRYEVINDNDDPTAINLTGFQFSELNHTVEHVILPFKERLEANGERLYINLNVVDFFSGRGNSNVFYPEQPQEYAELILAVFQHLQQKYGFTPNAVEIVLEPDNNTGWKTGQTVGQALVAAGDLLAAHGFTPDFIAPSTTNMGAAVRYFDEMITVPRVQNYLTEISYHRYSGVSEANLRAIAQRAEQHGLQTAMLEHIGSGPEDLHEDLNIGRNSAWQQFTLAFCANDNAAQYYWIDDTGPTVKMGAQTRYLRHYFRHIRRDAVRIEAIASHLAFAPLAFVNADGRYTVVIKTTSGGDFSVQQLPAGTYGVYYSLFGKSATDRLDIEITLTEAGTLRSAIPAPGLVTIYQKNLPSDSISTDQAKTQNTPVVSPPLPGDAVPPPRGSPLKQPCP